MQPEKKVFTLLRSAIISIIENKIILLPFLTIAFFQILAIEILYFSPKFPLNVFFGPLVSKLWSPVYMHYPQNLVFLPNLFQNFNIGLYLFLNTFLICTAVSMIGAINQGEKADIKTALKNLWPRYVHIVTLAVIIILMTLGLDWAYERVFRRALEIRSQSGKFYMLKIIILSSKPFISLLISVFAAAVLAYTFPLITLEKKNVFKALAENFKVLWRAWIFTFFIVFWPTLIASMFFMFRTADLTLKHPELSIFLVVLGLIVATLTDAVIYTAITTYYLAWKESRKEGR